MMTKKRFALAFTIGLAACVPAEGPVGEQTAAVVSGSSTPESLGFPLDRFQRHALLGARVGGVQGCSGTLVGDRMVVSAAHCVVTNQQQWANGAPPVVLAPGRLSFTSGDDLDTPLCVLQVQTIALHPDVDPTSVDFPHDISIEILRDSAMATCPGVVPMKANLDPLDASLVGESLLQGG